jgi:hypothetical protein
MIGDMTLCLVEPDYLERLRKAGERYDEALRVAGIKRAALANDRNEADGRVYEARKEFRAVLSEGRGTAE